MRTKADYLDNLKFSGATYDATRDNTRLHSQRRRVFTLMKDGEWRTLRQIASSTSDPEASVSAQLRNLRKLKFGGHQVAKRHRGVPKEGLYEYQLEVA